MTTDLQQIEAFFDSVEYSEEGRCYFADKRLDNGHEISFYARAATPDRRDLLLRAIEAFGRIAEHYADIVKLICTYLDANCTEYFDGASAFEVLGDALDITAIDANTMDDTRLTFRDNTQTMGGHFVVADFDRDWKLKHVGLSDV